MIKKKLPKIEALLFLAAQTVLDFQFSSKQSLLFFGRHTDSTYFWRAEKDPKFQAHTRLELSKFSNSIHMEWWCGEFFNYTLCGSKYIVVALW